MSVFGPQAANAATTQPPGKGVARYGAAQTWVKDASAPNANDGTVLDDAFYNRIIGALEYLVSTSGINGAPGDDTILYRSVIAAVAKDAPAALDTLAEIAAALGGDAGFASNVNNALNLRLRVDAAQTFNTTQKAQGVANLGLAAVSVSGNYADLSGKPTLGTAAALDVGTVAGDLVQLDGSAHLPAVDGSALTNVTVMWGNVSGKPAFGTAAALDVGTVAGNVVQLDPVTSKLPAVDGSLLTNLPAAGGSASLTANNSLSGTQTITNTTDASSAAAGGAFTIAGGLAVAKDLYVGNNIHLSSVSGTLNFGAATGSGAVIQLNYPGGGTAFGISFRPVTDNTNNIVFLNAAGVAVGSIQESSSATVYNTTSDKTLKEDGIDLADPAYVVVNTKIWDFRWKATGERSVGVFAQDAYDVCPQAVSPPLTEGDVWQVDYSKYVPYLIAHNQSLQRQLDGLKAAMAAK